MPWQHKQEVGTGFAKTGKDRMGQAVGESQTASRAAWLCDCVYGTEGRGHKGLKETKPGKDISCQRVARPLGLVC